TPTPAHEVRLKLLRSQVEATEERFRRLLPLLEAEQAAWEREATHLPAVTWSPTRGLVARPALGKLMVQPTPGARWTPGPDGGEAAVVLDGQRYLDAGDLGKFGFFDKFTVAAWVWPDAGGGGSIVSRTADTDRAEGYNLAVEGGKVHVHLVKRWLDDAIR